MSFPKLIGTGQLVTDPKTGPTKTGGTWCNAVVRFVRWAKGDGGGWVEADSTVASVVAFDDVADLLAGFAKGDSIDLAGTVSAGMWQGNPQLKITVERCQPHERNRNTTPAIGRAGGAVSSTQRSDRTHIPLSGSRTAISGRPQGSRSHLRAVPS